MENTNKNKSTFLLIQYALNPESIKSIQGEGVIFGVLDLINEPKYYYSELKPLSSISDKDAIEIIGITECNLRQNNENSACFGMSPSGIFIDTLDIYNESYLVGHKDMDYLRSKGYALPFNGLSVEQLISYNWIKLKP